MAQVDKALQTYVGNFNGYQGNPPTTEEEFNNLTPRGEGYSDTVWENTPPTWSEVQAKVAELDAVDAQKVTDKANAKAKLIAGEALTEAEADTLII